MINFVSIIFFRFNRQENGHSYNDNGKDKGNLPMIYMSSCTSFSDERAILTSAEDLTQK